MDLIAIFTLAIAVYAAGLSTYTLIAKRRDKRRRLSVGFTRGFLTGHSGLSDQMLFITVKNPGNRAVRINAPAIQLPDGRTLVIPAPNSDVSFPHDLEEGRDCRIWEPLEVIQEELREMGYTDTVRLIPFVDNAVGNRYRGKKWKIPIGKPNGT